MPEGKDVAKSLGVLMALIGEIPNGLRSVCGKLCWLEVRARLCASLALEILHSLWSSMSVAIVWSSRCMFGSYRFP